MLRHIIDLLKALIEGQLYESIMERGCLKNTFWQYWVCENLKLKVLKVFYPYHKIMSYQSYDLCYAVRSHTFAVRKRPEFLQDAVIHNINVRGKRGNIVQVYPAVEYDFVPNHLDMMPGEYVHYQ